MTTTLNRRHGRVLPYVYAALFAVAAGAVLRVTPFFSPPIALLLAVGAGLVALSSPSVAALCIVVFGSVPLIAADIVVGVAVMIGGLLVTQYLAEGRAVGFLLLALLVVLLPWHAEWVAVVLAGYLLGRGKGPLAAVTMCIVVEVAGLLLGQQALGSVITGGTAPGLIDLANMPAGSLNFEWLQAAIRAADVSRLLTVLGEATNLGALVIQPVIWAFAAFVSGSMRGVSARIRSIGGAAIAVAVVALGTTALRITTGFDTGVLPVTAVVAFAGSLALVAIYEIVFPLEGQQTLAPAVAAHGARAEDADVDDLLRIIASAEDELTTRHRAEAVVMITDMKSFSAMTEDLGSLESAKLVQRHRDLLLPIIDRHGGHGKSTGGDGLVAAFDSASSAIGAAVEMQRLLEERRHSSDISADVLVRIGIAEGEVVLDRGGRPFLGAALNLAARVMDLADGGRIMTTGQVASGLGERPDVLLHPHGEFKLKNIAEPQPVVEVLWKTDIDPQEIRVI